MNFKKQSFIISHKFIEWLELSQATCSNVHSCVCCPMENDIFLGGAQLGWLISALCGLLSSSRKTWTCSHHGSWATFQERENGSVQVLLRGRHGIHAILLPSLSISKSNSWSQPRFKEWGKRLYFWMGKCAKSHFKKHERRERNNYGFTNNLPQETWWPLVSNKRPNHPSSWHKRSRSLMPTYQNEFCRLTINGSVRGWAYDVCISVGLCVCLCVHVHMYMWTCVLLGLLRYRLLQEHLIKTRHFRTKDRSLTLVYRLC